MSSDGDGNWDDWYRVLKESVRDRLKVDIEAPSPFQELKAEPWLMALDSGAVNGLADAITAIAGTFSFNPFHADLLVGEAARLLDRAVVDRAEYHRHAVEGFRLWLEIQEFFWLDRIHRDEEKAGFYDLAKKKSMHEYDALRAQQTSPTGALKQINEVLKKFFTDEWRHRMTKKQGTGAWAGIVSNPNRFGGEPTNDLDKESGPNHPENHAHLAAEYAGEFGFEVQRHSLQAQKESLEGEIAAMVSRTDAAKEQYEWDTKDSEFRKQRTEASRQVVIQKVLAAIQNGGALNSWERMGVIAERFNRDVAHAMARLKAAQPMVDQLFGFRDALPTYDKDSPRPFDPLVTWTRNATNYLAAMATRMQHNVVAISVKRLMELEGRNWDDDAKEWCFEIDEGKFPSQFHVRLRGVSVYAVPRLRRGAWRFRLTCPTKSHVRHRIKPADPVDLDQAAVPQVVAGRVLDRQHPRTTEPVGETAFYNVSPFGCWKIERLGSTGDFDDDKLDDLEVDFHVSSVI